MEKELLLCTCSSPEHQIIVFWEEDALHDPDDIYFSIHLAKFRFWKRLWSGIKYIFGYKCVYGNFQEVILTKQQLTELVNKINNK